MADLFISYAREDEARVERLARALEERGLSVFFDRQIPAGQTWRSHIGQALSGARCVVVVWSPASIASNWVSEEADEAKRRGILVPVLLDLVEPPIGFRSIQAADLSDWEPGRTSPRFDKLLVDIRAILQATERLTVEKGVAETKPHSPKESRQSTSLKLGWHLPFILGAIIVALAASAYWYWRVHPSAPSVKNYFCGSKSFRVNATSISDTGLFIEKGSSIQAVASGQGIKFTSVDVGGGYGPQGENRIAQRPFPGVGLHEYALLAQVGADFYEIGAGANITPSNDGRLKFQFNDWKLDDNSGSAQLSITVKCQ
ncbi:MAG TPA: toll/interleukin-1 receptor domain-containing protein [Candidatus Binatia bacterium]|nr:toll/interleukin-1 receptor domain-containing protein [Candidatus Binatia bacterium]